MRILLHFEPHCGHLVLQLLCYCFAREHVKMNQSTIDVSNEVTLELRLDEWNVKIKFESLQQITHSVRS